MDRKRAAPARAPGRARTKRARINLGEAPKTGSLEQMFMDMCRKNPDGLSAKACEKEFKSFPLHEVTSVINKLLSQHMLLIYESSAEGIIYKLNSLDEAQKMTGLSREDLQIYQLIRESGNMGIWVRHLRMKARMQTNQVTKIIRGLTLRKLIKAHKSAESNKRVYMLYNIEPAKEVTGGIWYDGPEFDHALFNALYSTALKMIVSQGQATAVHVADFIRKSGVLSVSLSTEDISQIMHAMCMDGVIEPAPTQDDMMDYMSPLATAEPRMTRVYRAAKIGVPETEMASVPCMRCPVSHLCMDGGIISPTSCVYLKDWMEYNPDTDADKISSSGSSSSSNA